MQLIYPQENVDPQPIETIKMNDFSLEVSTAEFVALDAEAERRDQPRRSVFEKYINTFKI